MTARRQLTAGRVAFLARRDAIMAELEKGWSISAVYRQFAPHLPLGLRQFQIYVRRYLVEKVMPPFVPPSSVQPVVPPPPAPPASTISPPPPVTPKPVPSGPAFGPVGRVDPTNLY